MLSVHLCFVVAPVGVEPTLQSLVESDFKSDASCLFRHGAILPPLSRLEQEHRLSRLLSVFKTLPLPIRVIVALIGVTGFEPAAS